MGEDLKKLESLDYVPKSSTWAQGHPNGQNKCNCGLCAGSAPRATLGFNNAVIKPEMRVKKTEDAGQAPERKRLKNEKYYHQPHCNAPSHVKQFGKGVSCSCRQNIKIIPEMRVKKTEDAGQGVCKSCKGFGDKYCVQTGKMIPCPDCEPNQNIKIIEEIEGLISQVNEKLGDLPSCDLLMMALDEMDLFEKTIDLFEKTTLMELRKAFE